MGNDKRKQITTEKRFETSKERFCSNPIQRFGREKHPCCTYVPGRIRHIFKKEIFGLSTAELLTVENDLSVRLKPLKDDHRTQRTEYRLPSRLNAIMSRSVSHATGVCCQQQENVSI